MQGGEKIAIARDAPKTTAGDTAGVLAAGESSVQRHWLLQNILVSSAQVTWGTSPLSGCTQRTRRIEAGKRNLHPRRQELVAITAPPAIKCHKPPGPELTGRDTLCRGNPKEKGKQISPQFPQWQSWQRCCYETLLIPMAHVLLHCC